MFSGLVSGLVYFLFYLVNTYIQHKMENLHFDLFLSVVSNQHCANVAHLVEPIKYLKFYRTKKMAAAVAFLMIA